MMNLVYYNCWQRVLVIQVQELGLLNNPLLNAYGMTLVNGGQMHQVKAKVLTPPELCYGKGSKVSFVRDFDATEHLLNGKRISRCCYKYVVDRG